MMQKSRCAALVALLVLSATTAGRADGGHRLTFSGLLDDVTIASAGSWSVRGTWALTTKGHSGKGDFFAVLTMERSDYFLATNPGADPNDLATRNAHTHHVSVTDGAITPITGGFRLTGTAIVTANGGVAPFGTANSIQVDVIGGTIVQFSNMKLSFRGNAESHFGSLPLSGSVRRWK
jgi:hypothetical protein